MIRTVESDPAAGQRDRRSERRVTALALAGLAVWALLLFGPLVLTNRVLASGDVFTYFTPYRDFAAQALRSGHLPLWNPYLFMGAPFLANSQAAVFYPLHWPLAWLSTSRALVWSIVLHIWLAGALTCGWLRHGLRLRPLAAWLGGAVVVGSGFLGGHVGQINQLNAYAWFPALLWALSRARRTPSFDRAAALQLLIVIAGVSALQLLAGHTQAWYISVVGGGLYALAQWAQEQRQRAAPASAGRRTWPGPPGGWRSWALAGAMTGGWPLLILGLGLIGGLGLAAAQVWPTLELSALSPRADGLSYREAVSFSLKPQWLPWSLLPAFGQDLAVRFDSAAFAEFTAYVGLSGLALAAWGVRQALRQHWPLLALGLFGLALALGAFNPLYYLAYRLIPGWDLFRAPARWLLLYTVGMAGLAAVGVDRLLERKERRSAWLVGGATLLLCVELLLASQTLPHAHPTAPNAVTSLRNAPAYLLSEPGLWRFLSISGITYDPGDQAELTALFAGQLDSAALYDLIVASKQKEIIAPNLPLLWRIPAVDGYDGGVLPVRRYVDLLRVFVSAGGRLDEQPVPDGRLREQLRRIPPAPLLDLVNARFIITDKVFDVWVDNIYYDLQFSASLPAGASWRQTLAPDQPFEATALGVMSHLAGGAALPDGAPAAELIVSGRDGQRVPFSLRAGVETAEGAWQPGAAHAQARRGHPWPDHAAGQDYLATLALPVPFEIGAIEVVSRAAQGDFVLQAISLIDARTGASLALMTPGQGNFRRVHSGDVKIYEKRDVLPRAYVVPADGVIEVEDQAAALAALQQPGFDPAQQVILETGRQAPALAVAAASPGQAQIESYAPERVTISVTLAAPGILVLSDAIHPGWRAAVDGVPTMIEPANLLFRAVRLTPGTHRVVFDFAPDSLRRGVLVSLVTLALLAAAGLWAWAPARHPA